MTKMKFKKLENLTRVEAAARLSEIAKALRHSETFELDRDEEKIELDVPDEVTLEFEVELKDGKTEIEVEIKWASTAEMAESTEVASSS